MRRRAWGGGSGEIPRVQEAGGLLKTNGTWHLPWVNEAVSTVRGRPQWHTHRCAAVGARTEASWLSWIGVPPRLCTAS